jgi:hypothetical protein
MTLPGQASRSRKQLTYVAAVDLMVGKVLTANTPFSFVSQPFNVDFVGSLIEVAVRGIGEKTDGVSTHISTYFQIDNTGTLYKCGGYSSATGSAGTVTYGGTALISGLSVGAHTIDMYIVATTTASVDLRCSLTPTTHFAIDIAELR